jgi:hypothetical protein
MPDLECYIYAEEDMYGHTFWKSLIKIESGEILLNTAHDTFGEAANAVATFLLAYGK